MPDKTRPNWARKVCAINKVTLNGVRGRKYLVSREVEKRRRKRRKYSEKENICSPEEKSNDEGKGETYLDMEK